MNDSAGRVKKHALVPGLSQLRPSNPAFYEDAPFVLRRLREAGGIVRDEEAKVWVVSGYDAAYEVLNDRSLWRGQEKGEPSPGRDKFIRDNFTPHPETGEPVSYSLTQLDDPDHARVRGLLSKPLYARTTRAVGQINAIIDEVLDGLEGRSEFDLIADFAIPIPIKIIASILGIDVKQWAKFREWSEGMANFIIPRKTKQQQEVLASATGDLLRFFYELLQDRRHSPRDDLISDYALLRPSGATISDNELLSNLITLLTAGNLTTSDLIGNGVYLLLTHPSELQKLRDDTSIVNRVVEEVLRFDPPLDITVRIASHDLDVGGCPVSQTQNLTMMLRGANRDPAKFENPDIFNVSRKTNAHLSFGGGAHMCLGAGLARLEVQVAFAKLFSRFPNLRLAYPDIKPQRRLLPFVNGCEGYNVLT